MGWDAYAINAIDETIYTELSRHNPKFSRHRQAFLLAAKRVTSVTGSCDADLSGGALDCSNCAYMLQEATNRSCWSETPWSVDEVQTLSTEANWDFKVRREDLWAYYSAKVFLETCAELKLGIKFSF